MKRFRPESPDNTGVVAPSRRAALAGAAAFVAAGTAHAKPPDHPLWPTSGPPALRGAVIAQRRRRASVDGPPGGFGGGQAALPEYTRADFDALARAGANLVVMSFPELWSATPPYKRDAAMADLLDRQMDLARAAGLHVVVALRSGPGRSDFVFHREDAGSWFPRELIVDRIWIDREAQAAWSAMCVDTAKLVAGRRETAGLNLMVEPDPNVSGLDQTGQRMEVYDPAQYARRVGKLSDWKRIAARCAQAARAAAPRLPLLISPAGFARTEYLSGMDAPPVDNCVWCVHDYTPWDYTHVARNRVTVRADTRLTGEPSRFGSVLDAAGARTAPVFLGEFGAARWAVKTPDYMRDVIGQCEKRSVNWAAFRWPTSDKTYEQKDDMFNVLWDSRGDRFEPGNDAAISALRAGWKRNVRRLFRA
jgi:hypothetical protein